MSDPITRLNTTLEGRYAIERELETTGALDETGDRRFRLPNELS